MPNISQDLKSLSGNGWKITFPRKIRKIVWEGNHLQIHLYGTDPFHLKVECINISPDVDK